MFQDLVQNVARRSAGGGRLRTHDQAVLEDCTGHCLDDVGRDERLSTQERHTLRSPGQCQCAAWTDTEAEVGMFTCCCADPHHVSRDVGIDVDCFDRFARSQNFGVADDRCKIVDRMGQRLCREYPDLFVVCGVADMQADEEAVELSLGQRVLEGLWLNRMFWHLGFQVGNLSAPCIRVSRA